MKLYHGTTETAARAILAGEGLAPRGKSRSSLWEDHPSNPGAVYFTNTNPVYFADHARSCARSGERAAILEIDTGLLDEELLAPDEDFIEQASRGTSLIRAKSIEARTKKARELQRRLMHHWQDSLDSIGTACYFGTVPVRAITRSVALNLRTTRPETGRLWFALVDVGLGSLGFKITGSSRRELLRWILDGEVDIALVTGIAGQRFSREMNPEMWKLWESVLTPEVRAAFVDVIHDSRANAAISPIAKNHIDILAEAV